MVNVFYPIALIGQCSADYTSAGLDKRLNTATKYVQEAEHNTTVVAQNSKVKFFMPSSKIKK